MKLRKSQTMAILFMPMLILSNTAKADSDIGTEQEQELRRQNVSEYLVPGTSEKLFTTAEVDVLLASACGDSLLYLADHYSNDSYTEQELSNINIAMHALPESYIGVYPEDGSIPGTLAAQNPWGGGTTEQVFDRIINVTTNWCEFLPDIEGDKDNGLAYIQEFAWIYYRNDNAKLWIQGEDPSGEIVGNEHVGLNFIQEFTVERGAYMDSGASLGLVGNWVGSDRIEIEDFAVPEEGFANWNEFFTRSILIDTDSETGELSLRDRPVTKPDEDYIISSPTDCIMNPLTQVLSMDDTLITDTQYIENPLELNDVISVKRSPISVNELLGSAPESLKQNFVGGTGLSCVLMPNTYHSFHTPVSGVVKYKEVVNVGTYGYPDFVNWVPLDGNVGRSGSDFSQFQKFQRGVVVIEVKYDTTDNTGTTVTNTGYIASIPVGLDTIGSVVLADDYAIGDTVERGFTRLGNFRYGGSLNILLFSKGMVAPVVQTRLGSQIAVIDSGVTPELVPAIPPSNHTL